MKDAEKSQDILERNLEQGTTAGDEPGKDGSLMDLRDKSTGAVGIGGGGGGTFKGRGGMRRLSTHGGGAAAAAPPGYFNDGTSGDVRGREENTYGDLSASLPTAEGGLLGSARRTTRPSAHKPKPASASPTRRRSSRPCARRSPTRPLFEPSVVTDATGKATVKLKLPDNLTRWRATARGIAGDSLVGEGRGGIAARKDVLLRVDAPRFLVQGDEATIPSAVHNESGTELTAKVTMTAEGATLGGEDGTLVGAGRRPRDQGPPPRGEDAGRGAPRRPKRSRAQGGDKVEVAFGAAARGLRTIDGRSGTISTAKGDAQDTFLEVAEGSIPGTTSLTVVLYPGYDAAIVDALTYLDLFPYGCVEQTVHRFLPAAWARRALTAVGSPDAKRLEELDRVLAASVARLGNLALRRRLVRLVARGHGQRGHDGDGAARAARGGGRERAGRAGRGQPDGGGAAAHRALGPGRRAGARSLGARLGGAARRGGVPDHVPPAQRGAVGRRASRTSPSRRRRSGASSTRDDLVRLLLSRRTEDADTTKLVRRRRASACSAPSGSRRRSRCGR